MLLEHIATISVIERLSSADIFSTVFPTMERTVLIVSQKKESRVIGRES